MKVKVIERFIDKEIKKPREINTEFECTEKRLNEIQAAGRFVEVVKEKKTQLPEKVMKEKEKSKDGISIQGVKL